MMEHLIENFPNQLSEALEHARSLAIPVPPREFKNVYIAGVGGSAISGDIIKDLLKNECPIPIEVGRSYNIPAYIDENTLFFATSYSGNTEETLASLEEAKLRGCYIVCVSSGGELYQQSDSQNLYSVKLPKKKLIPRAQIGYPMVHMIYVLIKYGIAPESLIDNIQSAIDLIKFDQDDIKAKAEILAKELQGKLPILYTTDRMESITIRWRQQFNENSKKLCWHHIVPEMNHNELVGWHQRYKDSVVVYLRNKDDHHRNNIRITINKEVISKYTDSIIEMYSKGNSLLEKMIYFIHLGDWTSIYMASNNRVDPIAIEAIENLKGRLSAS